MGTYEQLKAAVAAVIHENGAEEITGDVMQQVLLTIINSLGAGATFAGVAVPTTNPSSPDAKMFYLAGKAGTYTNFNLTITKGLWVFENTTGSWVGHDLEVSMLFASGQDVTSTNIAATYSGAGNNASVTVGAMNEALAGIVGSVALSDLDSTRTAGLYRVIGVQSRVVGYLQVNTSLSGTYVIQFLASDISDFDDGYVADYKGHILTRSYSISGGTWSAWDEYGGGKFASGEKVADVSIAQTLGNSQTSVSSQKAVTDAIYNLIDIANIDAMKNDATLRTGGALARYTATTTLQGVTYKVGILDVMSDSAGHVLTQILTTHYTITSGVLDTSSHSDGAVRQYYRSVKINGGTLPTTDWTLWKPINDEQLDVLSAAVAAVKASVGYYVCDTAAGTAAKVVSATGYELATGGCIRIKMTNANTADSVTLNINSTGAKNLYYGGTQASSTNSWSAGEVLEVYYDGTRYRVEAMKVVNDLTTGGDNVALSAQQGVILRKMIDGGDDDVALTASWTSGKYYSYNSNTNKLGASNAGAAFNIASIDVHEYIGRSLTIHCMSSNANTYSGFVGSDGTTAVEHWQDTTTSDITKTVPAGAYYLLLTNSTSEMASPSVTLLGESLDERITKLEQGTDASKVTYGGTNVEDALDDLNEEVTDNLQSTANRVAYIEVTPSKNGTANKFWQYNSYQNKVTQSSANNFIAVAAHVNAGETLKFILPPNGTSAASSSYVMSDDGVLLETITNNTVAAGDTRTYNKDATAYLNYYNKSSNEVLATVSENCYSNLILTRKVDELTATSPSAELEGITVYCVGDSITAGQTLSDPTHTRWNAQLAEMYGWNLTVNATGGVPLSTNSDSTNAIAKKIDALASVTDIPDLIIIWGGHNDVWYQPAPLGDFSNLAEEDTSGVLPTYANKNTFCGALRYCAEVAHHYCPDAKVYFLTLEMCGTITPDLAMTLSAGKTVADMNNAIMEAGRRYQCGTIDMGLCGINCVNGVANDMTSDGIHPNLLGTKQIVAYLSKCLSNSFIKTRE